MRFLLPLLLFLHYALLSGSNPPLSRNICGDYVSEAYIREKLNLCPLADLERVAPYFPLIPKPFKATGGICRNCGRLTLGGWEYEEDEWETEEISYYDDITDKWTSTSSGCCYHLDFEDWYNCCPFCSYAPQGRGTIFYPCPGMAWDACYFDASTHHAFSFFEDYLHYCSENKNSLDLWPEVGEVARKINNLAYHRVNSLCSHELLQAEYLPYWKELNAHGRAISIVGYLFFYSQYHQAFLKQCQYIDTTFIEAKKAQKGIQKIYETLSEIQPLFLTLYSDILSSHPHPKILYERGMVHLHLGNAHASLFDIQRLIEEGEKSGDTSFLTSEIYQQEGQAYAEACSYDNALRALTKAIERNPKNKEAYFERAIAYFEMGDFDRALEDYISSGYQLKPYYDPSALNQNSAFCRGVLLGAAEGSLAFVPSLLSTVHGLTQCLWAFGSDPVGFSQEVVLNVTACIEFIKTHSTQEVLDQLVPEIGELVKDWTRLTEVERGEKMGYVVGKYGIDIFLGKAAFKQVEAWRALRKANATSTFSAYALSREQQRIIKGIAREKAMVHKALLREGKLNIQTDKQGKHLVNHRNYESGKSLFEHSDPQRLAHTHGGTGLRDAPVSPGTPGYKEIVDFKESIGRVVSKDGVVSKEQTNWGKIHYAKDGVHIVPCEPPNK